jgi:anti-anti-sigma factor
MEIFRRMFRSRQRQTNGNNLKRSEAIYKFAIKNLRQKENKMNYELTENGHYKLLVVYERLDFYNVSEFKKLFFDMISDSNEHVAIELKGNINEMSSSIIAVLLTGQKKMTALKRKMVLINVGEPVRNIFFLAGLTNIFTVLDDTSQLI